MSDDIWKKACNEHGSREAELLELLKECLGKWQWSIEAHQSTIRLFSDATTTYGNNDIERIDEIRKKISKAE